MRLSSDATALSGTRTKLFTFLNCITPTIGEVNRNYSIDLNNKVHGFLKASNVRGSFTGSGSYNFTIYNGTVKGDNNTQNVCIQCEKGTIMGMNGVYILPRDVGEGEDKVVGEVYIGVRGTSSCLISWFQGKVEARRHAIFLNGSTLLSATGLMIVEADNSTADPLLFINGGSVFNVGNDWILEENDGTKPILPDGLLPNDPTSLGTVWAANQKSSETITLVGTSQGVGITSGAMTIYVKAGRATINVRALEWDTAVKFFNINGIFSTDYAPAFDTKFVIPQKITDSAGTAVQIVCTVKTGGGLRFNFSSLTDNVAVDAINVIDDFTITWNYGA